jgi:ParB family chromosome partitioning protein
LALRGALTARPEAAIAIACFALLHAWRGERATGVRIELSSIDLAGAEPGELPAFFTDLPEGESALLQWCLAQPREALIGILAYGVAQSLDLAHDAASPGDDEKQSIGDILADALDLDMRSLWQPNLDFWSRVSKPVLLEAIAASPGHGKLSERRRDKDMKAYAKMKRDDLAKVAAKLLKNSGWLPDLLIAPLRVGGLELTSTGEAEASAIAAE